MKGSQGGMGGMGGMSGGMGAGKQLPAGFDFSKDLAQRRADVAARGPAPELPQGVMGVDPVALMQQMRSGLPQMPQGQGMPGGGMGGQMGGKGGGAPQGMPQGMPSMGGKGGR